MQPGSVWIRSSAGVNVTDRGFIESDLGIWLRQHGQNLWDENGEIGFEAELMAELVGRDVQTLAFARSRAGVEALQNVRRTPARL